MKKNIYIDSSDEEREKNVIKHVTKINYNNYLLTNILNIKSLIKKISRLIKIIFSYLILYLIKKFIFRKYLL